MKLSDFVEETLSEICDGILRARKASPSSWIAPGKVGNKIVFAEKTIEFDVAVTTEKGAGGGIKIVAFGDVSGTAKQSESHRIRFAVPVFFNSLVESERSNDA